MKYYFEKITDYDFEEAIEKITAELKKEGFGVLVKIEMHNTLKEKIDVNIKRYTILGACNPPFAYKSIQAEENIGIMLPCNVIVRESDSGKTVVAVVNPVSVMGEINNPKMEVIAQEIQAKLKNAIDNM